ncbi:hypothetical protein C4573_07025 [Candidatus Woesearchaeota archaeon]|nr:MAG: hypothetical protein C4573_07025 [Candidatus Woesearchaeota archaeon]
MLNLPQQRIMEKKAGFFKRLFAFILDLFVLNFIIFLPFQPMFSQYTPKAIIMAEALPASFYVMIILMGILSLFYFTLMEVYAKRTIGMMLLNIYAQGNLTFWTCVIRHMYIVPVFPFSVFLILDPLYYIFKGDRLTEIWTKTQTVEYVAI